MAFIDQNTSFKYGGIVAFCGQKSSSNWEIIVAFIDQKTFIKWGGIVGFGGQKSSLKWGECVLRWSKNPQRNVCMLWYSYLPSKCRPFMIRHSNKGSFYFLPFIHRKIHFDFCASNSNSSNSPSKLRNIVVKNLRQNT